MASLQWRPPSLLLSAQGYSSMAWPTSIARELVQAGAAWTSGNDGKARVCARRAVALASEAWLAQQQASLLGAGDAMAHLRRIQQERSFPSSVRQAAERLATAVTKKQTAPFTMDPIGDATTIIEFLIGSSETQP
ncbi:MAG: hypothetical protein IT389_14665 [Nitrospira sp.]|nr:hypothetical protein [Nitrospira sp.]